MIQPDGDDYYATTNIVRTGALSWSWTVSLRQPWPAIYCELDEDGGYCMTEKRARRKADRAVRRMLRAAASWVSMTTDAHGTTEETTR